MSDLNSKIITSEVITRITPVENTSNVETHLIYEMNHDGLITISTASIDIEHISDFRRFVQLPGLSNEVNIAQIRTTVGGYGDHIDLTFIYDFESGVLYEVDQFVANHFICNVMPYTKDRIISTYTINNGMTVSIVNDSRIKCGPVVHAAGIGGRNVDNPRCLPIYQELFLINTPDFYERDEAFPMAIAWTIGSRSVVKHVQYDIENHLQRFAFERALYGRTYK